MQGSVNELDRHKVVAAFIVSCVECELITREVEKGQVFLGLYMFPLEVGLNWMLLGLNEDLKRLTFQSRLINMQCRALLHAQLAILISSREIYITPIRWGRASIHWIYQKNCFYSSILHCWKMVLTLRYSHLTLPTPKAGEFLGLRPLPA